ncbi:MAG: thiamine diphosphokinase [Eubacteriales bacterium]|nr:thiamine diphosphokinase [Eubacteriales bacterium]
MIDTLIVSGGNIQRDFALAFLKKTMEKSGKQNLRLLAADKGLEFFMDAGIVPDTAVGDFDSLSAEGKRFLKDSGNGKMEILRLKPEKDDSDTQSAVNYAVGKGAKDIVILGATGSRIDHVLANIGLLSMGKELGVRISLVDERNRISLIESGTILKRNEQFGDFVSFFPVGAEVSGLTLKGFKYPLSGYQLRPSDSGLTVSNEIQEETAEVTFTEGTLLMIMSRD